jgi:hypothetical protein
VAADLHATEQWLVTHGLPYFVPEQRDAARAALHSSRTILMLVLTVLVALAGGVLLAWLTGSPAFAPATLMTLVGIAVTAFALTTLRARPIAAWAGTRTLGSLRLLVPLVTRALPLLLLFITFLFINAEVWELSASLDGAVLWITVMLFAALAAGFLWVRLPEELDRADRVISEEALVNACRGTPLERRAHTWAVETDTDLIEVQLELGRYERANLVLVLVVAQIVQVFLLAVSVFAFFMLFGGIVMTQETQASWTGVNGPGGLTELLPGSNLTVELLQVAVFLAAFSGFYFAVSAVSDEAYRDQFFTSVKRELDRAVAVRTLYLELRGRGASGASGASDASSRGEPTVT